MPGLCVPTSQEEGVVDFLAREVLHVQLASAAAVERVVLAAAAIAVDHSRTMMIHKKLLEHHHRHRPRILPPTDRDSLRSTTARLLQNTFLSSLCSLFLASQKETKGRYVQLQSQQPEESEVDRCSFL
jgi:hypothetical protein